jgi:cytochrome c oxidase subunit 3
MAVHEPYGTAVQQRLADQLGLWLFLASEVMLFGALFLAIGVYLLLFPEGVRAAVGRLDLASGGVETTLLLTSSLAMALAVKAAQEDRRRETIAELALAVLLGIGFEVLKIRSWLDEAGQGLFPGAAPPFLTDHQGAGLFFHLYFVATGLHAIHLLVGILLVSGLIGLGKLRAVTVELVGLYWQLVDIVWVLLFPLLYLVGR